MIASGLPDTIGNAVQARTRAPNKPAQLVSGVSSIDRIDWKDENNELDC
jgi:hypothetical protein